MNLQNKQTQGLREQTYGCGSGEGCGEGIVREFGLDKHTLLYLRWITNKDLTYYKAPGILLHVMWQLGWERSLGRMHTCICMAESLCFFFPQKHFLGIRREAEFQASGRSFLNSGPSKYSSLQCSPCQLSTSPDSRDTLGLQPHDAVRLYPHCLMRLV